MAATLAERLTAVQAAIDKILDGGQEVTVNGRTYRRADLKTLMDMEAALETRVAREGTSGRTVAEF